jgi:hypothetical protein
MNTAFNDHFDHGYDQATEFLLSISDDGEAFYRSMAEAMQSGALAALGIDPTPEQAEALRGWATGFASRAGTTIFVLANSREVDPRPSAAGFH